MSTEDVKRIYEKIQKCLRLAGSSNVHEAAAALRQAQKLMEMHGISEQDLELAGYSHLKVECPIQVNKKVVPMYLQHFLGLIKKAFGVKLVITDNIRISDASYLIHYFGPTHRVQMAGFAHVVMFRSMNAAWTKYLKDHPHMKGEKGARSSFMIGWIHGITEKIEAIGFPDKEKVATDLVIQANYRSLEKTVSGKVAWDDRAAGAGVLAARNFDVNRPMNQDKLRLT